MGQKLVAQWNPGKWQHGLKLARSQRILSALSYGQNRMPHIWAESHDAWTLLAKGTH